MVLDLSQITGLGEYTVEIKQDFHKGQPAKTRSLYKRGNKAFLVVNDATTMEVRTDDQLAQLLIGKYESVMQSRYFGRGGIEIVLAGAQLSTDELYDLIRLSYDLTT